METKTLRLEGLAGKTENQYVMNISVPGKLELLSMIEKPPFHIFSKDETTFSKGILAYVPHSIKLRISRDYQEPFVGVYIKLTPKVNEIIDIAEVRGSFTTAQELKAEAGTSSSSANAAASSSNKSSNAQRSQPQRCTAHAHSENGETYCFCTHPIDCYNPHNNNNGISPEVPKVTQFNFFTTSVSKLLDLECYTYYESRCNWPAKPSQLNVHIKVAKTTYSTLVNDGGCSSLESFEPTSSVLSSPYYLNDAYSDVTIHVGESTFPAHKIILSEKSHYFSRMFAHSMRETSEGVVRIAEEDESLFREVLRFIYQGAVENVREHVSELFVLSDKYDIPELAKFCEMHLVKQLSVDNAMEMFDLSQSVSLQGALAKKSKELIMWNRDKLASDLQTFKEFSRKYPEVIFELLQL